jgi:CheY-like chemotaxis protein
VDVLVVDPGELGELLATLLTQYGLSASLVQTGEQALGRALEERPNVVVIEAELADTSGLELAELLRAELHCKIVLTHPPGLSSNATVEVQRDVRARVRSLDAAFARPFRSLALIETVARLAERALVRPESPSSSLSSPLASTDGLAIEELIDIPIDDDAFLDAVAPPALSDHEVSFADLDDVMSGAPSPGPRGTPGAAAHLPILLLDDVDDTVTQKVPRGAKETSAEAARPLREVLDEEAQKKQSGAFSPGELVELWQRVKSRQVAASGTGPAATSTTQPAPEGTLTPRALADVLDAFHQSLTTGELWLESGEGRRVLLLKRGVLVGARSNLQGEDVLSLMVKRGAIDDDAAANVAALVKSGAFKTAADAVIALDLVPEKVLEGLVEEHVRRVAIGAFSWSSGSYRLTLEGRAAKEPVPAQVFVGDAIVHAMVLTESDASLEQAAPDDARFAPDQDGAYGLEHLKLSPQEARVVIAMDGTKTVSDLIALCKPLPPRVVRGLAAGLFCLHLTRFVGHGPAAARKISFF